MITVHVFYHHSSDERKKRKKGMSCFDFFSNYDGQLLCAILKLKFLLLEVCVSRNMGVISILTKLLNLMACTWKNELFYLTDFILSN